MQSDFHQSIVGLVKEVSHREMLVPTTEYICNFVILKYLFQILIHILIDVKFR
jgi:hypothetical protein